MQKMTKKFSLRLLSVLTAVCLLLVAAAMFTGVSAADDVE